MTYRANPRDGIAWVTGASSGIGRGVALELARRGYVVAASARRADELQSLASEAAGLAGRIEPAPVDVTDREAMAKVVADIEARAPIALAFLNAGGSFDDAPGDFGGDGFRKTFELNVFGVVNGLNPLMNAMKAQGQGPDRDQWIDRRLWRPAGRRRLCAEQGGDHQPRRRRQIFRRPQRRDRPDRQSRLRAHAVDRRQCPFRCPASSIATTPAGASATVSNAPGSRSLSRAGSPGCSRR